MTKINVTTPNLICFLKRNHIDDIYTSETGVTEILIHVECVQYKSWFSYKISRKPQKKLIPIGNISLNKLFLKKEDIHVFIEDDTNYLERKIGFDDVFKVINIKCDPDFFEAYSHMLKKRFSNDVKAGVYHKVLVHVCLQKDAFVYDQISGYPFPIIQ